MSISFCFESVWYQSVVAHKQALEAARLDGGKRHDRSGGVVRPARRAVSSPEHCLGPPRPGAAGSGVTFAFSPAAWLKCVCDDGLVPLSKRRSTTRIGFHPRRQTAQRSEARKRLYQSRERLVHKADGLVLRWASGTVGHRQATGAQRSEGQTECWSEEERLVVALECGR